MEKSATAPVLLKETDAGQNVHGKCFLRHLQGLNVLMAPSTKEFS
jgi:hypothetical protein